jgi:hypothetical protein
MYRKFKNSFPAGLGNMVTIPDADDLYREVRVENVLTDESGDKAGLKPGAEVDVIVEADSSATMKKP